MTTEVKGVDPEWSRGKNSLDGICLYGHNLEMKHGIRSASQPIGGMNAYAELSFPDAAEMLVKAQLVVKIAQILRERGWSQQEAAKVLGLTQPKLSKMLRGQFRGISEMKMMDCLVRLGRTVKIVVGPEGGAGDERIEVVAA